MPSVFPSLGSVGSASSGLPPQRLLAASKTITVATLAPPQVRCPPQGEGSENEEQPSCLQ